MFNIGLGEMVLIAVIALIFIGPRQLPEIAHSIGKMLNELKRAGEELTGHFISTRDNVDREIKKTAEQITTRVELSEERKALDLKNNLKESLKDLDKKS